MEIARPYVLQKETSRLSTAVTNNSIDYQALPSPPTNAFEQIDADFSNRVRREFIRSWHCDKYRAQKYGAAAEKSKPGMTPSPVREMYQAKQNMLESQMYDSTSDDTDLD